MYPSGQPLGVHETVSGGMVVLPVCCWATVLSFGSWLAVSAWGSFRQAARERHKNPATRAAKCLDMDRPKDKSLAREIMENSFRLRGTGRCRKAGPSLISIYLADRGRSPEIRPA